MCWSGRRSTGSTRWPSRSCRPWPSTACRSPRSPSTTCCSPTSRRSTAPRCWRGWSTCSSSAATPAATTCIRSTATTPSAASRPGEPADRDASPRFTRYALRDRGADYFDQTRNRAQDWKTLDDLAPQLAEFELRYQGEDYDTAAAVLLGIDFDYLLLLGPLPATWSTSTSGCKAS